jgi:hypothetical protein
MMPPRIASRALYRQVEQSANAKFEVFDHRQIAPVDWLARILPGH